MLDSVIILSLSRGLKYNENIFRKAGDRKIHTTIRGSKKTWGQRKAQVAYGQFENQCAGNKMGKGELQQMHLKKATQTKNIIHNS